MEVDTNHLYTPALLADGINLGCANSLRQVVGAEFQNQRIAARKDIFRAEGSLRPTSSFFAHSQESKNTRNLGLPVAFGQI